MPGVHLITSHYKSGASDPLFFQFLDDEGQAVTDVTAELRIQAGVTRYPVPGQLRDDGGFDFETSRA
ncbi:MAG: hypothetical protein FJX25_11700 [Alphaproteobacteria bacterium]|nr:hypothetical protein [Alphaproteobacteria bacterium]